jgi:hypothetical protein
MPGIKKLFQESAEQTAISTSYPLSFNAIEVTIIIGSIGQTGESEIWLNNMELDMNISGSFKRTYLPAEVNGKTMDIFTVVTDTSLLSNYTEVAVDIRGGLSHFQFPMHKEVVNEGESVFYQTSIRFFS